MHVDTCVVVHKSTQCSSPHYVIFAPLSKVSPGKSILVGDVRATLAQVRDLDTPGSPSAAPTLTPFTMGWLPSIFGGDAPNPLGKLDPKLREFLEKESPVKYIPNQTTTPARRQDAPATVESRAEPAAVPSASLYQDGRYAHLWKNYRPLAEVEEETSTDHDKLMAVLEGYKERKAAIARAGLENCAPQQEEWINCMKNGSWEDQLQMCRHQVRRFERCYTMQSV